jgi:ABC-type polysaccharide/polyol phosphate export permease
LLFFLCPIVYPESVVPDEFKWTIHYNPFAALIALYQKAILDGQAPNLDLALSVLIAAIIALLLGSYSYHRCREKFAEAL